MGNDDGGTNSITIAVVVCATILLVAIVIAVGAGYLYVKRLNVRDPKITPKRRANKTRNIESKVEANVEDGSYFNSSSTLSRSQVLPHSEKVGPENQYNSSKDWRPGTHRGASNGKHSEEFPTGIPYALRLKMSRRRRTNQRRNRRSRNRKPKVIPVDSRTTNSPSKLQPLQEIHEVSKISRENIEQSVSVFVPESHVPHLRVGPQSRVRNNRHQLQSSTFKIGPPSAKRFESRAAVQSIRVGPRSRSSPQNAHLPGNTGFEPSSARMDARDLDVRFASTPPVRIAVKPVHGSEVDRFSSSGDGFHV